MMSGQDFPDYTVVVIYDNNNSGNQRMVDQNPVSFFEFIYYYFSKFSNEDVDGRPIHVSYFTNRGTKGNKYTACIPKKLNDYFSTDEGKGHLKSQDLNVVRYNSRRNNKHQKVFGFFIPGPTEIPAGIFSNLEGKFVRPGSYKIIRPPADESGKIRDYSIVTFENNAKGVIPRQFIEKLKILIEDTAVGENLLRVKWLNRKVFEDISKGVNKKIVEQHSNKMEM